MSKLEELRQRSLKAAENFHEKNEAYWRAMAKAPQMGRADEGHQELKELRQALAASRIITKEIEDAFR